jgi:hypothetical protein
MLTARVEIIKTIPRKKIIRIIFALTVFLLIYVSISSANTVLIVAMLICVGIVGLWLHFSEKINAIGTMILFMDEIEIKLINTEPVRFPISKLKNLTIRIEGFDGDPYFFSPTTLFPKRGNLNTISFDYNNASYRYEILFREKNKRILSVIFKEWQTQLGKSVKFINEWGWTHSMRF